MPQAGGSGLWAGSAALRGPLSSLGYFADEVSPSDAAVVPPSAYELAPSQTDHARIGVPLDFANVEKPQPLRGDKDATNPRPPHVTLRPTRS